MARKRVIDPNFWTSEDIAKISVFARYVFIGMFSNADDEGRGRANTNYLKSVIFPYDDIRTVEVDKALSEISHNTSVVLYEHAGSKYYAFENWDKWQRVDHSQKSILPPPNDNSRENREPFANESGTTPPNLIEVNLIKTYDDFFENIWRLYPKKEGKGQVSKTQKEKLYKIGFDELSRCIERYKKSKKGVDSQYLQYGSTFFNSGYVDYLDCNYEKPVETSKYPDRTNYEPGG
ncbi:MAG: hypothetical protein PHQ35_09585 [Phycisphaerae bacterium]|nr:hypothetical protein [Phycisphaerae bacterium]MDD5239967.1 hypothetical protein [Candidatus Nanoarchaeia archaeon]